MRDLEKTLSTPQRYELKLNPRKYIFCVRSENFLGYLVTKKGIEVNIEKI